MFGFGAGAWIALLARSSVKRKEGKAEATNKKKEYSSKDLGALYYEGKRHLGEMVQQGSVLKLVEDG